jgi:hypothetical protein
MTRKRKTTGQAASNGGAASPEDKPKHELSRYELRKAGLLTKPDARQHHN